MLASAQKVFKNMEAYQPFLKQEILDRVCKQQFKFDENGRKFSEKVENIAGKGEIACYEQSFLFPQCFQKTCTADT